MLSGLNINLGAWSSSEAVLEAPEGRGGGIAALL